MLVDMIDARGVEAGGAADDTMNLVAFSQQQLGQIGTVLAGDACDECFFHECAFPHRNSRVTFSHFFAL